jgi:hypothetical protein
MRPTRRTFLQAAVLTAACLAGCSSKPKTVPVTGKVTHKGQGLTAGSIWFHPTGDNRWQGEKPSCQLGLDGSFTMRTYPHGQGVPPGSYKVTLSPDLASRIGRPDCADPNKTPLSIDVPDAGLADQVFEVK